MANLNWDKIIICTDADVDGYQIRTLIMTMFYRLAPSLLREGRVYIAESPLFEISTNKDTFFAYSEKEKTDIIKKIKGNYTLQRSKGLGENEPEMMWKTTMNPESRRLIKIEPEPDDLTQKMFDVLLGDDLDGRKSFISEFGEDYLELIDIS